MRFNTGSYGPPSTYGGHHSANDFVSAMEPENYGIKVDNQPNIELGINDIGMSVPMGIAAQNVAGIYSKIRMGAGKLEIQFPGYRSGNRNQQTPEMLGEDQRQAIREMQLANDVRFTTHASFGLMGFMGRDERGNFSVYNANQDLMELKRAIDFQADIGSGGSVVMHSGEFDRPMTDMHLDDETHRINLGRDESGRLLVKQAHTQEWDAQFNLLDARTSQKFETVQKDKLVAQPVWLRAKESKMGKDSEGNSAHIEKGDYVNYFGEKIPDKFMYDPTKGRVPHLKEDGRFDIKMQHFDYFKKEAEERNHWFVRHYGKQPDYYEKFFPEEMFMRATLETQEGYARGWALQLGKAAADDIDHLKKIDKAIEFYNKLDKSIPESEKWKIMEQVPEVGGYAGKFIPSESKTPLQILEETKKGIQKNLEYARQSSSSQEQTAEDTSETKKYLITPIKRLERHGVRMYAEAAIHAMKKTKNPDQPVVVAIENLFPERFGGHLEELKWIIQKSRDRMVEMLTKPKIPDGLSRKPFDQSNGELDPRLSDQENPFYMGISKHEAQELARKHLRATLDTGHLNMWRKYWQEDPKLAPEENDAKFKKWYLQQVESLAKADMIGNVHLADNFGYQDDHTSPGQGNAPIKEVVSILKRHGYDDAITVEPGADAATDNSDFHGLMKTWRLFGGNIYGMGGGGSASPQQWTGVQNSYFGQGNPPYFVFGSYAPSNDWTLWSNVPME